MNNTVIVIAGPTASGKTALSISLAKYFTGEIVSADSMQVYKRMDIGTAKATPEEQAQVPHHMIDIIEPDEDYSVARYVSDASAICDSLISVNTVPVIVGGTGLYIDSLISGRDFGASEDPVLRKSLEEKYSEIGGDAMLSELSVFDPERAAILHAADKKRIIRAFEVYLLSGETITAHDLKTQSIPPKYNPVFIIPSYRDRSLLYSSIDSRVDKMCSCGLFDEVRSLLESGIPENCTSMQAIGYKEPILAIKGRISESEAVDMIKQSSRRYAKRQLTWFNRRTDALRFYHEDYSSFDQLVESAIKHVKEFSHDYF